ncbi:MAG: hypothetical protein IJX14_05825, partial [Clostridia bacterium]|nr:hypothetical protein [Clostridia bacterium]
TDGYTLTVDGSFADNLRDGRLGVTLRRSPIYGDLRIFPIDPEDDYDFLSQGITEGRMRICFDAVTPAGAFAMAEHFADPPIVIDEAWHDGISSPARSFCTIDAGSTGMTVLKYAEAGEGFVLRLAEYDGKPDSVRLHLPERDAEVQMKPYEIKTIRCVGTAVTEVSMLET